MSELQQAIAVIVFWTLFFAVREWKWNRDKRKRQ